MEDFKNIDIDNNLTFEPRLQEYIKKLNYYKKYNIAPPFNLEREYSITREDKIKIKNFLHGRYDITKIELQEERDEYVIPAQNTFGITHDDYKKDPRYERLQKKLQRDRDATQNRHSYGNGAEIQGNDNKFITDEQYQKLEESKHFLDNKPYYSDYALNVGHHSKRVYDVHPLKIQYNQRPHNSQHRDSRQDLPHDNNLSNIIAKLDSFKKHTNTIYQHPQHMDIYSNQKINNNNQAVPMRGNRVNLIGGTRDVDIENCLIKGLPERNAKFKSLGYPNYSDHSFGYISGDIQDPKHVVLPFPRGGEASRLENDFRRAKPYQRQII